MKKLIAKLFLLGGLFVAATAGADTLTATQTFTQTATPTSTRTVTLTVTPTTTPTATQTRTPFPYVNALNVWGPLYGACTDGPGNTIAFLEMENDVSDKIGIYTWTNQSTVTFSDTIYKNGSYSAFFDATDNDELIYSSAPVTHVVKSVEFYLYLPTGHRTDSSYPYVVQNSECVVQTFGAGGKTLFLYVCGDYAAGSYDLPALDTWYNIGINLDGANAKLYVDNTERLSRACATQPTNKTHYWGGHYNPGNTLGGYIDDARLFSCVSASFPN